MTEESPSPAAPKMQITDRRREAFAAMLDGTTPGPWEVGAVVDDADDENSSPRWEIYRKEDDHLLAVVYSSPADARVIAESLSLLHGLVKALHDLENGDKEAGCRE